MAKNSLLLGELEKLVFDGKLNAAALNDVHDALADKLMIDDSNQVAFKDGGALLADGLAAFVETRPYLHPPAASGPSESDRLAQLKADAVTSVTARGTLYKQIGAAKFAEWEAANSKKPAGGDNAQAIAKIEADLVALKGGKKPSDADRPNNPWSAGSWSVTRQGELVRTLGIAKAASIAKAAGSFVGATKPARAA
jgi:hypothetical protein